MILVACAVETELAFLSPRDGVDTLITGVGPVEASAAIAAALASRPYDLFVSAGVAGAFDGAARIGDGVVVATDTMEVRLEDGGAIALPRGARTLEDLGDRFEGARRACFGAGEPRLKAPDR